MTATLRVCLGTAAAAADDDDDGKLVRMSRAKNQPVVRQRLRW